MIGRNRLPPTEIEGTGVWVAGQIEDLTSRFNLNSLVRWDTTTNQLEPNLRQIEVFQHLLASQNVDQRYADLLADWLDTNINPQPNGGGEDTLYLAQSPPYRPPNTMITHPSEILALPAFGAENYAKIAPYITALPWYVGVNPCTAALVIIDMVNNDGQSQWQTAPMGNNRQKGCWPDKQMVNSGFPIRPRRRTPCRTTPRSLTGSACAPTSVLALRSSFCTVSFTAKRTTACVLFSAALEASNQSWSR